MSDLGYLFAGFALAWLAVFAYVGYLTRRAADLQQRLEALEHRLDDE